MKTFLRRWWIVNTLFHFLRDLDVIWVEETLFADWVVKKSGGEQAYWYKNPPRYRGIYYLGFKHLLNGKTVKTKRREIINLITECSMKGVELIDTPDSENMDDLKKKTGRSTTAPSAHMTLSSRGLEIYAVTYLIFGHDYARKIWTGVIVGLVVLWTGYVLGDIKIESPIVQIEYVQPQQISTTTTQGN